VLSLASSFATLIKLQTANMALSNSRVEAVLSLYGEFVFSGICDDNSDDTASMPLALLKAKAGKCANAR
jgi:hypothetical protein